MCGESSRPASNFGNLQRVRTNYAPISNLQASPAETENARGTAGGGGLIRNQFCAVADLCGELYASQSSGQAPQFVNDSASNYSVSYMDQSFICTDNNCENDECDAM